MIFLQADLDEFAGFRPTLAEATRVMADDPEMTVTYSVDPSGMTKDGVRLPQVSRRMTRDEVLLARGTAETLPFPDNTFDLVVSLNTIHNLPRLAAVRAMAEIERVSKGNGFVVVDSYRTPEQKEIFASWVLTAEFHDYPEVWVALFNEAGYTGDWNWTIIE